MRRKYNKRKRKAMIIDGHIYHKNMENFCITGWKEINFLGVKHEK